MNESYLKNIKEIFKGSYDVKYKEIQCKNGVITIIFIDNMCNSEYISHYMIRPITEKRNEISDIEYLKNEVIEADSIGDVKGMDDALLHILNGDAVIISNFFSEIMFCEAKGYVRRSVSIPTTEDVVKGPREGFTEAFVDNVSLIRRKIKNPDLKFEAIFYGDKSNTIIVIAYIKGIAPKGLVEYVKKKIKEKKEEFILDTNYIEEKLKNNNTVFDTVGYSEKPDIVSSKLLEGRVGVIVDGTPFVVTVPYFFIENFNMPDDYYLNKIVTNITRVLRWISFFIAVFLPGLYLALISYHYAMIPYSFVFRIAISRSGVPFPTVIELLLMMLFFQILREAGVRLPKVVGAAVSIVGALILGDSAIKAGLASEATLIVVALSSIATFVTPKLYGAEEVWSIILVLFASVLGLFGFYIGVMIFVIQICRVESCGYPYTFPLGTGGLFKYKDVIFRSNLNSISDNILKKDEKK